MAGDPRESARDDARPGQSVRDPGLDCAHLLARRNATARGYQDRPGRAVRLGIRTRGTEDVSLFRPRSRPRQHADRAIESPANELPEEDPRVPPGRGAEHSQDAPRGSEPSGSDDYDERAAYDEHHVVGWNVGARGEEHALPFQDDEQSGRLGQSA